jgi:undecaprenyl-diphosphatase
MLEALLAWDEGVFRLINGQWQSHTLDTLLPLMTHGKNFYLPLGIAAVMLVVLGGWRGRRLVLLALAGVLLADAVSTYAVKYPIWRPRPCIALEGVRLLVGCVNSPSFPSNHAANASALVTLVSLAAPALLLPAVIFAGLVAYSRVYVGAHYPLDVLSGAVLGMSVALLLSWGMTHLLRVLDIWQDRSPYARRRAHMLKINEP